VHRQRGESAPDLEPIALPSGRTIIPEVKSRKRLPALALGALRQAAGYVARPAIPIAVLFELGARWGIVACYLEDFAALVGLDAAKLPEERKPKRKRKAAPPPSQLALFEVAA
jgi:hypothetical protein